MTLTPAILESQEYARRLVLKVDGATLPYDEAIGGFNIDTAAPVFVTSGTAATRAALAGDPGQLFYETNTSVLMEWTNAAAWKALGAPGPWTAASLPPGLSGSTDEAYEGLSVYLEDTGDVMVLRRSRLGTSISGSNLLGWVQASKNRAQVANPFSNASGAVWQRGVSVTPADGAVGPDRFYNYGRSDIVYSRQLAGDTQGSPYCIRVQRPNGNSDVTGTYIEQSIPIVDALRFAGNLCTFSVRARKGSGSSVSTLIAYLQSGTGSSDERMQGETVGFTGQEEVGVRGLTLTTSWQTLTFTGTPEAIMTQLGVQLVPDTWVGTAGANDYIEFKDLRLDLGPWVVEHVPLHFEEDLAQCQRFYETSDANAPGTFSGNVTSGSSYYVQQRFAVPKRAAPTMAYTIGSVTSFPSTNPTATSTGTTGFVAQATANASAAGLFQFTWTASAEI